ncbi:MAG: T9SS type A sorting domain-containing protein, partial [bacterium]
ATSTWGPLMPGIPLANQQTGKNKKAKDGSDAVLLDGVIWALKGGNTQDFYAYDIATSTWAEKETIPAVGTTGKKKRVKAGGSITTDGTVLYALKGNKTAEFWRFDPAAMLSSRPDRSGVMAEKTVRAAGFSIGPNPLAGSAATLRFVLPAAGPATLRVFDVTGRTVLTRSLAVSRRGSTQLDLRSLSAGVYLVKLTSVGSSANVKLVIQ